MGESYCYEILKDIPTESVMEFVLFTVLVSKLTEAIKRIIYVW